MSPSALRRRALLSGTMLAAAALGYGRRAYGGASGGACVNSGGSTYQCSGANVLPQTITANNANVSTVAGFIVNTPAGNAITITGDGALSYIDGNASPLIATTGTALSVVSGGDFAGTPGSVTINTTGTLNGSAGLDARNYGSGTLTITANGNVTGTGIFGIYAKNGGAQGTDLTVTTAAGTTVSGATNGMFVRNAGRGALTITANGNVTGANTFGIYASNGGLGTTLSVTTAAGTTVSGANYGIDAINVGSGALTVTANGNVTGTNGSGIFARNISGTDLSVSTAAGTTIRGSHYGIVVRNYGTGALTITANGDVSGSAGPGILARNYGTALSVTTAAGTTVSGANYGINVRNFGTGALTVTANGNVTGTSGIGINAKNYGTNLSVTVGAGAAVSGGLDGIYARNQGTGVLAITVAATGTVNGGSRFGIQALRGPATVTVAGTVNGGASGAINFDQTGAFANRLELVTGAVVNGNVLGGTGIDTLGLSGSGSGSFNVAQLSSFEAGEKTGSGSWTLTGTNAGITAFSVGAGTLLVNGSLSNAAFTVSGGTLGGTGTVGNITINGGTLAPGSAAGAFGPLTVQGNLSFTAASAYMIQISSVNAGLTNVSGTATLAGTVQVTSPTNSFRFNSPYTILTSAGLGGSQFNALTTPAGTTGSLIYSGNNVLLNLASGLGQIAGLGVNQHNVGAALDAVFNASGNPGAFGAVFAGNIPQNLTQLSGETATGSQQSTFGAMNQFMGVLTDPFIDGRGDGAGGGANTASGYASTERPAAIRDAYAMFTKAAPAVSFEQRWSVWAAGFGGSQTTDGNAALGSNTATSRLAGTAVGADYHISPFTIAGFALAGGGTSFSVANGGSGRSDLFQAGAFIRHTVGAAYLSGALAYGWQDITTDRTVTVAGIDHLHAEFNANAYSGRVEGGYRFVSPWSGGIGITPYAAAQFTTFDLPAYAEQALVGANTFALAYGSKSVTDTRSELGVRTDKSFAVQNGVLTLRGRFAWAHDYDPDRAIAATFQALPGASFVVNGAAQSHNSALTTASAEMKWMNGWSAAATFEGEFSNVTRSYAGKGVVRYAW